MESNQTSNLANSSNMGPLPQVSGFTFVVKPSTANDLYGSSFFHQRIAGRIPIRLPQKLFPKFEDYSCFAPEVRVRESNQKEPRQFTN